MKLFLGFSMSVAWRKVAELSILQYFIPLDFLKYSYYTLFLHQNIHPCMHGSSKVDQFAAAAAAAM